AQPGARVRMAHREDGHDGPVTVGKVVSSHRHRDEHRDDGAHGDAQRRPQAPGGRRQLALEERKEPHRPLIVTTAVAPMRKGRWGSRSSRRMRTGKRLARRTQLRVRGTSGGTRKLAAGYGWWGE